MERFIKEYSNYKIKTINNNESMQMEFKIEKIEKIYHILKMREKGLITIDEVMKIISEI